MSYKRYIILCLVLIICSSIVAAAPEEVFSKIIADKTTITLNDTTYTVRVGDRNNSLVKIVGQNQTFQLEVGDCIKKKHDEFCYESFEKEGQINGNQTDFRPILEIDRDISEKKLELGETSTITTTFENTGGSAITDFTFTEVIPSFLLIDNVTGCNVDNNRITMNAKFGADESQTCTYILRASVIGKSSYFGTISTSQVKSSDIDAVPQVDIEATESFPFNITLSKYDLEAYQPFVVTIQSENPNKDGSDTNISLRPVVLHLDDVFEVSKVYNGDMVAVERTENVTFSVDMEPEEKIEQRIELIPASLKNETLRLTLNYSINEDGKDTETGSFELNIPLNISFQELTCDYIVVDDAGNNLISLQKINNTLPGLDIGELSLVLINRNNYLDFSDLSYSTSGDFDFPNSGVTKNIRRNDETIFASSSFFFSETNPRNYSTTAEIRYSPREGDLFKQSCDTSIFVPKPKLLDVKKDLIFVNETIDGVSKDVSRIVITISNIFYDGLKPINYVESFPSYFFTNADFEDELAINEGANLQLEYDFVIPDEYVPLETKKEMVTSFFEITINGVTIQINESIEVDIAQVINHQKSVSVESIIEDKLSLIQQDIPKTNNSMNFTAPEPIIVSTYSPILPYFSAAMVLILIFFIYIIFRNHYNRILLLAKKKFKAKKVKSKKDHLAKDVEVVEKTKQQAIENVSHYVEDLEKAKQEYAYLEKEADQVQKDLSQKKKKWSSQLDIKKKKLNELLSKKREFDRIMDKKISSVDGEKSNLEADLNQANTDMEQTKLFLQRKSLELKELENKIKAEEQRVKNLYMKSVSLDEEYKQVQKRNQEEIDLKKALIEKKLNELEENRKLLKEEQESLNSSTEE